MPRRCQSCGAPYLRRNLVEVWVVRAPGRREGWVKQLIRQCLRCQPEARSMQLLRVMQVRVTVAGLAGRRARAR